MAIALIDSLVKPLDGFIKMGTDIQTHADHIIDMTNGLTPKSIALALWNQLNICKYNYLTNSKLIGVFRNKIKCS